MYSSSIFCIYLLDEGMSAGLENNILPVLLHEGLTAGLGINILYVLTWWGSASWSGHQYSAWTYVMRVCKLVRTTIFCMYLRDEGLPAGPLVRASIFCMYLRDEGLPAGAGINILHVLTWWGSASWSEHQYSACTVVEWRPWTVPLPGVPPQYYLDI